MWPRVYLNRAGVGPLLSLSCVVPANTCWTERARLAVSHGGGEVTEASRCGRQGQVCTVASPPPGGGGSPRGFQKEGCTYAQMWKDADVTDTDNVTANGT